MAPGLTMPRLSSLAGGPDRCKNSVVAAQQYPEGIAPRPEPGRPVRLRATLLHSLGIPAGDDTLREAADLLGGIDRLSGLLDERPADELIAAAWKQYLDRLRCKPGQRPTNDALLLTLFLIREAFSGHQSMARSGLSSELRLRGMNWLGTWREINLRYAGQLYEHTRAFAARELDDVARAVRFEALRAWEVVEQLDGPATIQQRRLWRGMRAVTRLWLARRDADPSSLLLGAIADFEVAQECGDSSEQHCVLYVEALVRAHEATGSSSWLETAERVLKMAENSGHSSAALVAASGDLWFARGLLLRSATIDADDDADWGQTPVVPSVPTEDPTRELHRNAAAAFELARSAYALAVDAAGLDTVNGDVWRYRRGQATARLCQASRLVGSETSAVLSSMLHEAAQDLSICENPGSKINGPYWPSAVRAWILHDLRAGIHVDSDQAVALIDRALAYAARETLNDASNVERLVRLRLEVELRAAERVQDVALAVSLLGPATLDPQFPLSPLIYAARLATSALEPGVPLENQEPWERVDGVVRRLLAHADAEGTEQPDRQFAASHSATLLHLSTRRTGLDLRMARRMLEASHLSLPVPPDDPLRQFQRARVASRCARVLAVAGGVDEVEEAIELFTESITLLQGLLARVEGEDVSPRCDDTALGVASGPVADRETDSAAGLETVLDAASLHSLVGDDHLRRDSIAPAVDDLHAAITHLRRSIELGNASSNVQGLLGDAHGRLGRRNRNPEHLRRAIECKRAARSNGEAPSRESYSVEASASLLLWRLQHQPHDYVAAAQSAAWAAAVDPAWPWPVLQLAELVGSPGHAPDLPKDPPRDPSTGITSDQADWRLVRARDDDALQERACRRAIESKEFRSRVLGGVSKTYVLDDPHRLLSTTLVLKPTRTEQAAAREAERLTSFSRYLDQSRLGFWAETVTPLASLPVGSGGILATRRSSGRTLFSILLEASRYDDHARHVAAEGQLARAVELLAHVHAWRGLSPSAGADQFVGRARTRLEGWLDQLGVPGARDLGARWAASVPTGLPLVGKRDAHAANWIVTDRGRIVALDLQHNEWLPLGLEVAQLVEDTPLVTTAGEPTAMRRRLSERYLTTLEQALPALGLLPEPLSDAWSRTYTAFAFHRVVFLEWRYRRRSISASSSGERGATGAVLEHTRAAAEWCAETNVELYLLVEALSRSAETRNEKSG